MSFLTSDLPSTLLLIAIGVIIGAALTKILNRSSNATELQQKLEDTEEKLNNYQQEVSNHFQKTAELVNKLTLSYQDVHQHLSQGAQGLVKQTTETLENSSFKSLSDSNTTNNTELDSDGLSTNYSNKESEQHETK